MNENTIILILRMILCSEQLMAWLEEQAKKTDTPIDDLTIKVIKLLLCGKEK